MAVITSAIAVGVAAVGTFASIRQAKKATAAGQDANEALRKANRLKNKQAKRAFLRNFRQAQANVLVSSVMAGVGLESSAFQGTLASEKSQRDLALKEFERADELGTEFLTAQNRQTSAQTRSSAFGSIAGFASSFIAFPPSPA